MARGRSAVRSFALCLLATISFSAHLCMHTALAGAATVDPQPTSTVIGPDQVTHEATTSGSASAGNAEASTSEPKPTSLEQATHEAPVTMSSSSSTEAATSEPQTLEPLTDEPEQITTATGAVTDHEGPTSTTAPTASAGVDCELGDWVPRRNSSKCSQRCGTGTLVQIRPVVSEAWGLGQPCPAQDSNERKRLVGCWIKSCRRHIVFQIRKFRLILHNMAHSDLQLPDILDRLRIRLQYHFEQSIFKPFYIVLAVVTRAINGMQRRAENVEIDVSLQSDTDNGPVTVPSNATDEDALLSSLQEEEAFVNTTEAEFYPSQTSAYR